MIFSTEPDGSCAGRDSTPTNPPPPVPPPPALWKVPTAIIAIIEVGSYDAATEGEARAFAADLTKDLALKVTMGGVPLAAKFASNS